MSCRVESELPCVPGKEPVVDPSGRLLHIRAPEVPFSWSAEFWEETNRQIDREIDRTDAQVVVLTPYLNDVGHVLSKSFKDRPWGKYPAAFTKEYEFPDKVLKILVDHEAPCAKSVYIVASILNERDAMRVMNVADHYKRTLGARYVTLVCPYMPTREDKNVNPEEKYEPSTTSIRTLMGALSVFVDRMFVIEPHSSATQYYAAEFGMPLAPISPLELMAGTLQRKMSGKGIIISPQNFIFIQPDSGRIIASTRISRLLNLPSVSFIKHRLSGRQVFFEELPETEQEMVKGKIGISYDDEASTMGTLHALAEMLQRYGMRSLVTCVVHCKFTPGWETKIDHPMFSLILGTDSRQPVGNLKIAKNIELTSLEPLITELIEADLRGVNFWQDSRFKRMILQEEQLSQ